MSVKVFTNCYITVATVDLSARCVEVEIEDGYTEIDMRAMSNTAGNTGVGMKEQSIKATFMQDYSPGSVHATLNAANGTTSAVVVRTETGAASAANPQYTLAAGLLTNYVPIGAKVNDKQLVTVTFKTTGTALAYSAP